MHQLFEKVLPEPYNKRKLTFEAVERQIPDPKKIILSSDTKNNEDTKASSISSDKQAYVHFGVGCDGCGQFPIVGRRYRCKDVSKMPSCSFLIDFLFLEKCPEKIGFDLCGNCFDSGLSVTGRFNQSHLKTHRVQLVEQKETLLHKLQEQNKNVPTSQLLDWIARHFTAENVIGLEEREQESEEEESEEEEEELEEHREQENGNQNGQSNNNL